LYPCSNCVNSPGPFLALLLDGGTVGFAGGWLAIGMRGSELGAAGAGERNIAVNSPGWPWVGAGAAGFVTSSELGPGADDGGVAWGATNICVNVPGPFC
jgi:hypothetical protein